MICHPIRWLWGLIPIAMLTWLAVHLESGPIERDLEQRSGAALSSAGHDWASVVFAGRDGLLVGHAASGQQRDDAAALVRDVWGVRVVEARVALSAPVVTPPLLAPKTKLRLPVASAAQEVAVHATLNDVAPTAVAVARGEIRRSDDHPPEWTVQARDEVAPTVPPAAAPLPQAKDAQPPASAAAQPAVAAGASLPEHKTTPEEPGSRVIAADVPEVPARKPAIAEAPAPPESVAAASSTPPVPEHKPDSDPDPVPVTAPEPSLPAPAAPPLPQRGPRFETAALPPSNIAPERDCVAGVRSAAGPVEVHFAHGRAKLDTRGKALIDRLIGALNTCPEAALNVAGHSDASGRARRNLALSKHRARTVTSYMIHKGIDAGRLVAIGYGDKRPVAPNDTQANRAKNRRIEVAITARAAPLPPLPVRKQGTEHGLSRR